MSDVGGRFGGGDEDSGSAGTPPAESPYTPGVQAAIQAYWDAIGRSDADRISYLVNPMFLGAPAWPGVRQTYRVVRTPHTVILSSDGLADPDPQVTPPAPGMGCEVYLETRALVGADLATLQGSWQFKAIESLAQNVAYLGGLTQPLRDYSVLSMELPVPEAPPQVLSPSGMLGCLVGVTPQGRAAYATSPVGPIAMVPMTLVRPEDFAQVVAGGHQARVAYANHLISQGHGHVSVV